MGYLEVLHAPTKEGATADHTRYRAQGSGFSPPPLLSLGWEALTSHGPQRPSLPLISQSIAVSSEFVCSPVLPLGRPSSDAFAIVLRPIEARCPARAPARSAGTGKGTCGKDGPLASPTVAGVPDRAGSRHHGRAARGRHGTHRPPEPAGPRPPDASRPPPTTAKPQCPPRARVRPRARGGGTVGGAARAPPHAPLAVSRAGPRTWTAVECPMIGLIFFV